MNPTIAEAALTRRSVFAFLAVAIAALTSWRPLVARTHRPGYRGSMRGEEAVVFRPDGSRLDPLPLVLVESMPNIWVNKYTPRPYPVSGFAWGPIRSDLGRDQLAAAVLLDPTPGAYRRPDLLEASTWRYRPQPEDLERARSLRAAFIERQARRAG